MRTIDNDLRENARVLREMDLNKQKMQDEKLAREQKERSEFLAQLDRYRKQGETKKMKKVALSESIYNEYLSDAFKAVYITALGPISSRAQSIAINCVDNYIRENNGAKNIMIKNSGKTYLLDTIFEAVQKAHDIELEKALREEALLEAEEKKAKKDGGDEDFDFDFDAEDGNTEDDFKPADDNEAPAEEPPVEDTSSEEDKGAEVDNQDGVDISDSAVDDLVDKTEDDSAADGEMDTDAEDAAEEETEDQAQGDAGGMDSEAEKARQDIENDMNPEEVNSKEDMFEQLDDDEEVHNAIDIIANRIQDAEAEFVRKNADDKQKIETIVNKLSQRISAATKDPEDAIGTGTPAGDDLSMEAPTQETALLIERYNLDAAKQIKDVYSRRVKSVFEVMVSDISEHILKTQVLREDYIEGGKIDMDSIIEDAMVTYGFLEFVNTVQLEKVDSKFIKNYLNKKL